MKETNAAETAQQQQGAGQTIRDKVIQNYENRIRSLSSPEKVFNYFSSVSKDGEAFMTPEDFIRSLTPYDFPSGGTPSEKKDWKEVAGKLEIPAFFKYCDSNGDGLLSFQEYFFFITLLSIPAHEFEIAFKMIDADSNGVIDEKEFLTVLKAMKDRSVAGQKQRTFTDITKEPFMPSLPFFFGADGKKTLSFEQFSKFLRDLQVEVRRLEFNLYDKQKTGVISLYDFGRLLLGHANLKNMQDYQKRLETVSKTETISFEEFNRFEDLLNGLDDMQVAVETYGGDAHFTPASFQKAAYAVSNIKLSPKQVEVLFKIFDVDGDGKLEPEELVEVMKRHRTHALSEPRDLGFTRIVRCVSSCFSHNS